MNIKEELIRQRDILMSSIQSSEELYSPAGKIKFEEMVIQSEAQSNLELENDMSPVSSNCIPLIKNPSKSTVKVRNSIKSTKKSSMRDLIKNPEGEGIRN